MRGNQTDADNRPPIQGNSVPADGYSLAEALRALEPEIERELADLDQALGELRDAAAVERVSATVAKPATPTANGQAHSPKPQMRAQSHERQPCETGRQAFVTPASQSRPGGAQLRFDEPPVRPSPTPSFKQAEPVVAASATIEQIGRAHV